MLLFKTTAIELLKSGEAIVHAIEFKNMVKPLFKTTVFAMLSPTWPQSTTLGNSFNSKLIL